MILNMMNIRLSTIVKMEKSPDRLTVGELGKWYHAMWPDGKAIIEKWIDDIFLH